MIAFTIFVGLCAAVSSISATSEDVRTIWDYAVEHGAGSNMSVPMQALSRDDVQRWAAIIDASEAQLNFMLLMYNRFVEEHNEFLDSEAPAYLALTQQLTDTWRNEGLSTPAFVEMVRQVDLANAKIRRELTSIEQSYIDSIKSILMPQQQQRINILISDSIRRNCRAFHSYGRWMDVELRQLWNESASEIASPMERQVVDDLLDAYELRLTTLTCHYADLQLQRRTQLAENRVAREQGIVTLDQSHTRYSQIMRRRVSAARDIRRLNEATVDRIVDVLSYEPASAFVNAARHAAFPELYPDRGDLDNLLLVLEKDEDIDGATLQELVTISGHFRREHRRMCLDMERMCIVWGDKTEEGIAGYEPQLLANALTPLKVERLNLSRRYLEELVELLGPDVLARHADAIPSALKSEFAELLEMADETGN